MTKSEVSVWINKKFLEWQLIQGESANQYEFADYLGVSEATLSLWINDIKPPGKHSADLIAAKFGPEIYDLIGLPRPYMISTINLPHEIRDNLTDAIYKVNLELSSRGLSGDSPEADEITTKIFEEHGVKYTRIIKK